VDLEKSCIPRGRLTLDSTLLYTLYSVLAGESYIFRFAHIYFVFPQLLLLQLLLHRQLLMLHIKTKKCKLLLLLKNIGISPK